MQPAHLNARDLPGLLPHTGFMLWGEKFLFLCLSFLRYKARGLGKVSETLSLLHFRGCLYLTNLQFVPCVGARIFTLRYTVDPGSPLLKTHLLSPVVLKVKSLFHRQASMAL